MTEERDEQIELAENVLKHAIDGADQPHQEVTNRLRYEEMIRGLRPLLVSIKKSKNQRLEIEGLRDADYINAFVERSEKTMPDSNDALLAVDGRLMDLVMANMGLTKEVGDLSELLFGKVYNGERLGMTEVKAKVGNIFWFLSIFIREFEIDLEDALLDTLTKLDRKYPEAGVLSAE